jgi:hypothetical protein
MLAVLPSMDLRLGDQLLKQPLVAPPLNSFRREVAGGFFYARKRTIDAVGLIDVTTDRYVVSTSALVGV